MDPFKVGWQPKTADCGSREVHSLNNSSVEVDGTQHHAQSVSPRIIGSRTRAENVLRNIKTSKDLLKLLSRTWHIEQQNLTSLSLFSALKFELESACTHLNEYILGNESNWSDTAVLLKQFAEEKAVWRIKEIDRKKQFEVEIKTRKQTERHNKKLGKELAETKASLLRANQDLEREKDARGILEQVCDKLAVGVGEEDGAEVEKALEMLQLTNVLREERVEMKPLEAKSQFEEKNAVVGKLSDLPETVLKWTKQGEEEDGGSPSSDTIKALEKHLRETLPGLTGGHAQERVNGRDGVLDDSDDSDLHCIELKVDEISKSCDWNDTEPKRNSEDKSLGWKFISEDIKRPTSYSETKFTHGAELESTQNKQESHDVLDAKGLFEFISRSWRNSK